METIGAVLAWIVTLLGQVRAGLASRPLLTAFVPLLVGIVVAVAVYFKQGESRAQVADLKKYFADRIEIETKTVLSALQKEGVSATPKVENVVRKSLIDFLPIYLNPYPPGIPVTNHGNAEELHEKLYGKPKKPTVYEMLKYNQDYAIRQAVEEAKQELRAKMERKEEKDS